jgi:hypothetical protein
MGSRKIVFNGINALTGGYVEEPLRESELAARIRSTRRELTDERELGWWRRKYQDDSVARGPAADVDPMDLASSGWGVIFPVDIPPEVREALRPLREHRRVQATRYREQSYRELEYSPGESKDAFLRRYKVDRGPADPRQLPYYLLLVGDLEAIPHRFQYLLDLQYAVGRLAFSTAEEYARYAQSVVDAEGGQHHVRPEMTFFSVAQRGDEATQKSKEYLVDPLCADLGQERDEWTIQRPSWAGKAELTKILGGGETPALLFTAAHGLGLRSGHRRQAREQGAIVCQDWRRNSGPLRREHYFAADDVGDDARLHGLIAFHFGCYSAGTPRMDNFPPPPLRNPIQRAPRAFLSPLAQRLLGHPNGGALAVLGHVDRTWTRTFGSHFEEAPPVGDASRRSRGYLHIASLVKNLLDGFPVGAAMDWMHERYAEISTELTEVLDAQKESLSTHAPDKGLSASRMTGLWRANNDARNFVVLGDPAVRLAAGPRAALLGMELSGARSAGDLRRRGGGDFKKVLERLGGRDAVRPSVSPVEAIRARRERE